MPMLKGLDSDILPPPITLSVGTTSFRVRSTRTGLIGGKVQASRFISSVLTESEYVEKYKCNVATKRYILYDMERNMAIFPRYSLDAFCNFLGTQSNAQVAIEPNPVVIPRDIRLKMKSKFKPRPEQESLIEFMVSRRNYKPVSAQTGIGKQMPNQTRIKTPGGWRHLGTLRVGDVVTAVDGTPTRVTGVYPQGKQIVYKIVFADGRWVEAGGEHLWEVYTENDVRILSTHRIIREMYRWDNRVFIPYVQSEVSNIKYTKEEIEYAYTVGKGNERKWEKGFDSNKGHALRVAFVQGVLENRYRILNDTLYCEVHTFDGAKQMQYVVRSLGGFCCFEKKGDGYRLEIRHSDKAKMFRSPDVQLKVSNIPSSIYDLTLEIKSITKQTRKECTCISVAHPRRLYVANGFVVTHNTFCSEVAICELKVVTMIVLNSLIKQWYDSLRLHTTIKPDEIYVIQGVDALKKLWLAYGNGYRPSVIIFSTRTLILYAINPKLPYSELPSYADFCQAFGVGLKVMDEVHLGFHGNTMIDLQSNIRHNIYLSATYQRTDRVGNNIFNMIFPPPMRYGEQFFEKYTVVYMVGYTLGILPEHDHKFRTHKGYNNILYENFILSKKYHFDEFCDHIRKATDRYYIQRKGIGQRLLILCQTKKFAQAIAAYMSRTFPQLKTHSFFSGTAGKLGSEKNLKGDIIVSTHKSCGTGRDIPLLKSCINVVSFASAPLAGQVMGRLRKIKGEETLFVDMWNTELGSHRIHSAKRVTVYKQKALRIHQITL